MIASNVRSSLALEILLHANSRYSFFFYLFIIGTYIYKLCIMDYPMHVELPELVIILLFAPIEAIRIKWAHRGNLTETPVYLTFSLLLGVAVGAICFYVVFLQAYVYMVERCLAGIQLAFISVESVFKVAAIASFSRSETHVIPNSM